MIKNKNIVLTGCNSGIGYEVLMLLLKGDNKVLCVDRETYNLDKLKDDNAIVMKMDVGTQEGVDAVFARAEKEFDFIDIFYANAGYPYYEELNYVDWDRTKAMFDTNVFSPIYSYEKYREYLDGRDGIMAITVSAIGTMAMPGFTIYSSSKFAMHGFQQGLRLELPKNIQLTCLYPIATDTNFFYTANEVKFYKPFPVQNPKHVAKCMVNGIEKGKKNVSPSKLFDFAIQLMKFVPVVRTLYWGEELIKFKSYKKEVAKKHPKKSKKVY